MTRHYEKFDAVKKQKYIDLLRRGGRRVASARACGVNPRTVEKHMHRYPKFAQEVSQAEPEANEWVETALFKAAVEGNVTACLAWSYSRDPNRWADRRGRVDVHLRRPERVVDQVTIEEHAQQLSVMEELGIIDRNRISAIVSGGGDVLPSNGHALLIDGSGI